MSNSSETNDSAKSGEGKAGVQRPGPWFVTDGEWEVEQPRSNKQSCVEWHHIADFEGNVVALVVGCGWNFADFSSETRRRARLIAAAPDLLEALKTVDYLLNELADERTPANVEMTPAEAALVAFRKHTAAAISRAEGGQ